MQHSSLTVGIEERVKKQRKTADWAEKRANLYRMIHSARMTLMVRRVRIRDFLPVVKSPLDDPRENNETIIRRAEVTAVGQDQDLQHKVLATISIYNLIKMKNTSNCGTRAFFVT